MHETSVFRMMVPRGADDRLRVDLDVSPEVADAAADAIDEPTDATVANATEKLDPVSAPEAQDFVLSHVAEAIADAKPWTSDDFAAIKVEIDGDAESLIEVGARPEVVDEFRRLSQHWLRGSLFRAAADAGVDVDRGMDDEDALDRERTRELLVTGKIVRLLRNRPEEASGPGAMARILSAIPVLRMDPPRRPANQPLSGGADAGTGKGSMRTKERSPDRGNGKAEESATHARGRKPSSKQAGSRRPHRETGGGGEAWTAVATEEPPDSPSTAVTIPEIDPVKSHLPAHPDEAERHLEVTLRALQRLRGLRTAVEDREFLHSRGSNDASQPQDGATAEHEGGLLATVGNFFKREGSVTARFDSATETNAAEGPQTVSLGDPLGKAFGEITSVPEIQPIIDSLTIGLKDEDVPLSYAARVMDRTVEALERHSNRLAYTMAKKPPTWLATKGIEVNAETLSILDAGRPWPSVRAIGYGDLVVAKDRLVGYQARELAHVENVMAGETRERRHERVHEVEETRETESEKIEETERDLQTTDRYELQSEASKTVEESYSVKGGVKVTGTYGLTTVEANAEAGFQGSTSEARSQATNVAKEVVSRSVESIQRREREFRRRRVLDRITETNLHALQGGDKNRSGLYYWVEKLQEVQLYHYGMRLLLELYIPEPGVSLLPESLADAKDKPEKPPVFDVLPADVTPASYQELVERFEASGVNAPPPAKKWVGFKWVSQPDESARDWKEEVGSGEVKIPDGYAPVSAFGSYTSHHDQKWKDEAEFSMHVSLGGHRLLATHQEIGGTFGGKNNKVHLSGLPAGEKLPWVVRARDHWDKVAVLSVGIVCDRTSEELDRWRLETFDALLEAHKIQQDDYARKLAEATLGGLSIQGRPAQENREVERAELKKWSIKAMRGVPFDFDAVEPRQVHLNGGGNGSGDASMLEVEGMDEPQLHRIAGFFEGAFEWDNITYFLDPYYWSRRETWQDRFQIDLVDAEHERFLRAGGARVILPVTPGFERHVLDYLYGDGPELDRLPSHEGSAASGEPPELGTDNETAQALWLEVFLERRKDAARGSGTISIDPNDDTLVHVDDGSLWVPDSDDLGRELFIDGRTYVISEVIDDTTVKIDPAYEGAQRENLRYAMGPVQYGEPWTVTLPTSLVILGDQRDQLSSA